MWSVSRGFSVGSAGMSSELVTPDQLGWNTAVLVDVLCDSISFIMKRQGWTEVTPANANSPLCSDVKLTDHAVKQQEGEVTFATWGFMILQVGLWDCWCVHVHWSEDCVCPYCAEIMMGIKVCSRDTGGGIWRLLWVSRYSYIWHTKGLLQIRTPTDKQRCCMQTFKTLNLIQTKSIIFSSSIFSLLIFLGN